MEWSFDSTSSGVLSWFCVFEWAWAVRLQRSWTQVRARGTYFCKGYYTVPRFCFASSSYQVSTTARRSSRRKPQAQTSNQPQTTLVLQTSAWALCLHRLRRVRLARFRSNMHAPDGPRHPAHNGRAPRLFNGITGERRTHRGLGARRLLLGPRYEPTADAWIKQNKVN